MPPLTRQAATICSICIYLITSYESTFRCLLSKVLSKQDADDNMEASGDDEEESSAEETSSASEDDESEVHPPSPRLSCCSERLAHVIETMPVPCVGVASNEYLRAKGFVRKR